jgi:predicted nucleic acid-binding Zn ribbon protein
MAKRPPLSRPLAVKDVLQNLLSPGDREGLELRQRIRQVWERAAPAAMREHARLVDLRRRELWVEVPDGAWGQELQFLKPRILEELARVLGPDQVRDLRIRVGGEG